MTHLPPKTIPCSRRDLSADATRRATPLPPRRHSPRDASPPEDAPHLASHPLAPKTACRQGPTLQQINCIRAICLRLLISLKLLFRVSDSWKPRRKILQISRERRLVVCLYNLAELDCIMPT